MTELGRLSFINPRSFYVYAKVFDSQAEMYAFIHSKRRDPAGCDAMFMDYRQIRTRSLSRCLGTLVFNQRHLGPGVVCREAGHAALNYLRHKGLDLDIDDGAWGVSPTDPEEAYRLAHGNLVAQFWERWYASQDLPLEKLKPRVTLKLSTLSGRG